MTAPSRIGADVRRWLLRERSPWALTGFVGLLGVSVAMLTVAGFTQDYARDLLLNLGAGLVTLAFGSVFFEPVIEQARRGRVMELPSFDHVRFCARLAEAEHSVSFLGTWTGLLEQENRALFLATLARALDRGVSARFLLLAPDSSAAAQRAEDLKNVDRPDARDLIRENLHTLDDFAARRAEQCRAPEVRIYDASVSESLYRLDERAIVGKLPLDRLGSNSTQYEAGVTHPLMTALVMRFDQLWEHPTTLDLAGYMKLPADLHAYGTDGRLLAVCAVTMRYVVGGDGWWYVSAWDAEDVVLEPGVATLRAAVTRPAEQPAVFTLVPVMGSAKDLRAAITAKYGPRTVPGRVYRLRPDGGDMPSAQR